jgi:hypothetical protein
LYTMVDSCMSVYDSIVHTYHDVKGCTGKYEVAYTAVVYAYNMSHQCTVYVHVYTLYVHVYAMYIHVLTSCFNMMGRLQLMPLFLAGNSTPTIAPVTLHQLMACVAAICMR